MIYKVIPGSKTEDRIQQILRQCETTKTAIKLYLKGIGADSEYLRPPRHLAGLMAFRFPDGVDIQKYKKVKVPVDGTWYEPKKNCEHYDQFKQIPRYGSDEISKIVNYNMETGGFMQICIGPGFEQIGPALILTTPEWSKWRPKKDLQEITMSELEALRKKKSKNPK